MPPTLPIPRPPSEGPCRGDTAHREQSLWSQRIAKAVVRVQSRECPSGPGCLIESREKASVEEGCWEPPHRYPGLID